jgi:hypothetical protein
MAQHASRGPATCKIARSLVWKVGTTEWWQGSPVFLKRTYRVPGRETIGHRFRTINQIKAILVSALS